MRFDDGAGNERAHAHAAMGREVRAVAVCHEDVDPVDFPGRCEAHLCIACRLNGIAQQIDDRLRQLDFLSEHDKVGIHRVNLECDGSALCLRRSERGDGFYQGGNGEGRRFVDHMAAKSAEPTHKMRQGRSLAVNQRSDLSNFRIGNAGDGMQMPGLDRQCR